VCSLCLCVFVVQLSWQASEENLREAFAECGEISNVRIAWDAEQDRSKGFGHVEFGQWKEINVMCTKMETRYVTKLRLTFYPFGFVSVGFCFSVSEESVDAAVKCAGKEVAGRQIRVDYAPGHFESTRCPALYPDRS
jgi:RNA recognition motif-containing protein